MAAVHHGAQVRLGILVVVAGPADHRNRERSDCVSLDYIAVVDISRTVAAKEVVAEEVVKDR